MAWDEDLLPEQKKAVVHSGVHARLLAGPGTGKTRALTRHICFLVEEKGTPPENILVVTFTRAAARELRHRIKDELGARQCPRISTLHSFALRQLLKNKKPIIELPQPLRIADDWEERNIILEDLKSLIGLKDIKEARAKLNELSSDWESLEERNLDPKFIGAWQQHRMVYGYTLRAELVYQLKKALEQRGDFELEKSIDHFLVDEYQDLNKCDLAVVHEVASRGAELFIAGDDDQSIYGFRNAHPDGIRDFHTEYSNSKTFPLEVCMRCDSKIIDISRDVIQQDVGRTDKNIRPEPDRAQGQVAILRFGEQNKEAAGIANLCSYLINRRKISPGNILILLRSDRNGAFSRPIQKALQEKEIPVSSGAGVNVLNEKGGRSVLAFLRLAINPEDSLAWGTLFNVWCQGVGPVARQEIYRVAQRNHKTFARTILESGNRNSFSTKISGAIDKVSNKLEELFPENVTSDNLMPAIRNATESLVLNENTKIAIMSKFQRAMELIDSKTLEEVVRAVEIVDENIDQEIEQDQIDKISILSMHLAKGLTAKAVIVVAAEDQYIPGRATGIEIDDERRLMYVSLTRAKHHLFVTYCDNRTGEQRHTGRDSGQIARSLSRFLASIVQAPEDGETFVARLVEGNK